MAAEQGADGPEPNTSTASRVASMRIGDGVTPGEAGAVQGAADPVPERPVPADIVALSARMQPRPLPIPVTRAGMTHRFNFGDDQRGWFARVPGGQGLLTPAYAEGKIFLGGGFGSSQFYAYNARSGDPLWAASAPDGGPTAAIVEDDRVLFNTESCTLFAIDSNTGEHLWRRWLGDPLMGQPATANDLVFSGHIVDRRSPGSLRPATTGWGVAGGRRYGFTAMRVRDGRPRWTREISADVMNGPVLDGRSVFFTTMDGRVYHLDQRTGRQRWRRELGATSAPWLHEGEVHVTVREQADAGDSDDAEAPLPAARRERTVVLSRTRGETLRELDAVDAQFLADRADSGGVRRGWAYEGSRPTIRDGRSYQTIGNEVHCRDVASGDLLWRRQYTDDASARPASPPAVAGGQLVFGTRDGQLFALDVDTGMTAWAYDLDEPINAQPSIAHGWVYASTARGGVLGIEVSDPSFDGWHMWGGSAGHNGPTLGTTPPFEDDSRPSEGSLRLGEEPNYGELGGFPIQRTRVRARVTGFVARVQVEQTFDNPYERPVQADYQFPVPQDATVTGMVMRAGGREVRAEVRARDELTPEEGADGTTVTVLEQERPGVFRQRVRNVRPSESVTVTLEYTQVLPFDEGAYRFTFPLRAGSRYERATGDGYNPEGTPLERRLEPGDERPDAVELTLEAEGGTALDASSPSHRVDVTQPDARRTRVELSEPAPPDRDLEVRLAVQADQPTGAIVASPPAGDAPGYVALALHPTVGDEAPAMARELVIVLDRSSSMRGAARDMMVAAARRALDGLRDGDTFRVLTLDGPIEGVPPEPLEATPQNLARARAAVSGVVMRGTGSREGLLAALDPPDDPDRLRVVVLLTDGYLGNEREVFSEVRERLGAARLFALGAGTAVNQYLLTRLVELGRGELEVVALDADPERVARAFEARIGRPYLTDLSLRFDGLAVADVYPRRLPDVYADRPVVVHGRYDAGGDGRVVLSGRIAGEPFEQVIEVTLPEAGEARPELASVWAGTRIRDALTAMALSPNASLAQRVEDLGVEHGMLTPYTTFVAVDPGDPRPVITDDGVDDAAPSSTRPARNSDAHVTACYAASRDDEGVVDAEALSECLAGAD